MKMINDTCRVMMTSILLLFAVFSSATVSAQPAKQPVNVKVYGEGIYKFAPNDMTLTYIIENYRPAPSEALDDAKIQELKDKINSELLLKRSNDRNDIKNHLAKYKGVNVKFFDLKYSEIRYQYHEYNDNDNDNGHYIFDKVVIQMNNPDQVNETIKWIDSQFELATLDDFKEGYNYDISDLEHNALQEAMKVVKAKAKVVASSLGDEYAGMSILSVIEQPGRGLIKNRIKRIKLRPYAPIDFEYEIKIKASINLNLKIDRLLN